MSNFPESLSVEKPVHAWLKQVHLFYSPGIAHPLVDQVVEKLLAQFQQNDHIVQDAPSDSTDLLLTSAPYGEPLSWRKAFLFTSRRKFNLKHTPAVVTIIPVDPRTLEKSLAHFERALAKPAPDPRDFEFPGLARDAYQVLYEQGRRGGPIMALERVLQAQVKSIRILLLVGDNEPERIYHFDLVGAHPTSEASAGEPFYTDVMLRVVTSLSTREITDHEVSPDVISRSTWDKLITPQAMRKAAHQLGKRNFFTEMVRIADLVNVPAVADAVSSQYSEGCFTTWEPELNALITTVTGSARPVDKGSISEDDLAVIVGVRPDGRGAQVRHVEGKRNDPPSSEAVEMMDMDSTLPYIALPTARKSSRSVPVIRSKLHGHRGIQAYDPNLVEHVPLDPPYYHYPVSCATEAQATGIKQAFSRSKALQNPSDPRQVVFTVLPGHGIVIAEKWVADTQPFQVIWEFMDAGRLKVDNRIPQGEVIYKPGPDNLMVLHS